VGLLIDPSNHNSAELVILYALIVAYLNRDAQFDAYTTNLGIRIKGLASERHMDHVPSSRVIYSPTLSSFVNNWASITKVKDALTKTGHIPIVEALCHMQILNRADDLWLQQHIARNISAIEKHIILGENFSGEEKPAPPNQQIDSGSEFIGDIDSVSDILNRILNWMGPPPSPTFANANVGPSSTSPAGSR
jgi:hypothetical protein